MGNRKPTVSQRMNRKTDSSCANCPEPIYTANEATIATVVIGGQERYTLVHKACEAEYLEAFEQQEA